MKEYVFTYCMELCERVFEDAKTSTEDRIIALMAIGYLKSLLEDEED